MWLLDLRCFCHLASAVVLATATCTESRPALFCMPAVKRTWVQLKTPHRTRPPPRLRNQLLTRVISFYFFNFFLLRGTNRLFVSDPAVCRLQMRPTCRKRRRQICPMWFLPVMLARTPCSLIMETSLGINAPSVSKQALEPWQRSWHAITQSWKHPLVVHAGSWDPLCHVVQILPRWGPHLQIKK